MNTGSLQHISHHGLGVKGTTFFDQRNMESSTPPPDSPLSSALTDPGAYFSDLQTARDLIAAYSPRSRNDYTVSLLNAILDSEGIIGRSGIKNVLDDIQVVCENHSNLSDLAEHYMTSIYYPRIPPAPPLSKSSQLTPPSKSQGQHPFSTSHASTWWI